MRVLGKNAKGDTYNYLQVIDHKVDITTDVPPSILHLASYWDASVEFLGTQEELLSLVDPTLSPTMNAQISAIKHRAQSNGYKLGDEEALIADTMFITEIASPLMFGALLAKNI